MELAVVAQQERKAVPQFAVAFFTLSVEVRETEQVLMLRLNSLWNLSP
jgi:hypothetical protein